MTDTAGVDRAPMPGAPTATPLVPEVDANDDTRPLWRRLAATRWGDGPLGAALGVAVLTVAVGLSGYQIYTALFLPLDAYLHRALHLSFVLVLVFLVRPAGRGSWARSWPMGIVDAALVLLAAAASLYPVLYFEEIATRAGDPTGLDLLMGTLMLLVLLEAGRRVIGLFMSVLVVCFMLYAWGGSLLPGPLANRSYLYERIVYHSYLFQEGIYGFPLGVAATFVFVFILFGAVLQKTGGGNFFIGLAYCLTGRYAGGPAKGAVLGSALMGSISGSALANTVTTGSFTIPLMKRVGYRPHQAGGVEAAASTGGQVLPPIMGAGAFVMAEFLGVPYIDIVAVAVIPAFMYFFTVFLLVDLVARKNGIGGLAAADLPRLRAVMAAGWHFLVPFVLLITLLVNYVTPLYAGLYAAGALLAVAMLRQVSRLSARDIGEVFVIAARNTLTVSVACAMAGVIVGMVGLTGLGLTFSSMMLGIGDWPVLGDMQLLMTLVMVALASLVLGLGLPVTAAYIVLMVLAVPALEELGVAAIVAHMVVYWYSQDSNVTPPVALAAFSAAGVAGSDPMRTGLAAWKFAKGLYLIPLLMVYSPIMLDGGWGEVTWAVVSGTVALTAFAVALEGFLARRALWVERLGLVAAGTLIVVPGLATDAAGVLLTAALLAAQALRRPTSG